MQYGFMYRDGGFYAEDVPIKEIARAVGTPCYIYSYATLVENFGVLSDAFSRITPLICYSVKANSNLSVLRTFAKLGAGFDIVSGGELVRVLRAGGDPSRVVFSGVGKTEEEMRAAIQAGILSFNVESIEELYLLNTVAKGLGKKARISVRVNPDIDPRTHPYISTGLKKSKFGIEVGRALEVYKKAESMEAIEIVGLDAHIGSQIFDLSPFVASVRKLVKLADIIGKEGIGIQYIDIGGGLGIKYKKEDSPPHPKDYADIIIEEIDSTYKLILEPGRSLVGNAGVLVTKVLYVKKGASKNFVIVDAAMNDLIRPAFYDSHHEILKVDNTVADDETVDIVGPICESGDFFAKDRRLPRVKNDDLLAILSAGAYGFVMSSNYNTRPRVPEVMVKGEKFFIIRQRETYEDLIRGEAMPDWLE
jgi:diaminopimelate decarboxylase